MQKQSRLTLAIAATLFCAMVAPAHATLIQYNGAGTINAGGGLGQNAIGESFTMRAVVDTSLETVVSYEMLIDNFGGWAGSGGGTTSADSTRLSLFLGSDNSVILAPGFLPYRFFSFLIDIEDPLGRFADLIDGYPTSFNDIGSYSTQYFVFADSTYIDFVRGDYSSLNGELYVPTPPTAALALAGLAALGAARREKARSLDEA